MVTRLKRFLIGRPMKSDELADEKLGKLKALAVLSSALRFMHDVEL